MKEFTGSLHLALHRFLRSDKERYQKNADVKGNARHRSLEEIHGREACPEGSVVNRSGIEAGRGIEAERGTAAVGMKLNG